MNALKIDNLPRVDCPDDHYRIADHYKCVEHKGQRFWIVQVEQEEVHTPHTPTKEAQHAQPDRRHLRVV